MTRTGQRRAGRGIDWGAAGLGWIVAVAAGIIISPILRFIFGIFAEPPIERAEFTAAIVGISLLSGFLAHVAGGYAAGRFAGTSGGLNGAMTAVFGLIVGIILGIAFAIVGIIFTEGVAMPPASFVGLGWAALLAALILFLVNLLGGFLGGRWSRS